MLADGPQEKIMDQEKQDAPAGVPHEDVRVSIDEQAGGIFQTYSNHLVTSWTAHDIRLRFSEMYRLPEPKPDSEKVLRIEERACVTLAWSQAKALRDALTTIIERFEKVNGEIKQPTVP
jgi:hypothetical protein